MLVLKVHQATGGQHLEFAWLCLPAFVEYHHNERRPDTM
jgi:hypothetical protein